MIRKLTICVAFSTFCAFSNAQNNMPSALDHLATQCQQVIDLNDTIKAREAKLYELTGQLEELKQDWLYTCNEALSSPACDDNTTRINTINELIQLTDPKLEAGLLSQLKEARNNPEIRTLMRDGSSSSSPRHKNTGHRNTSKKDNPTESKLTGQPAPKTVDDSSDTDKAKKEEDGNAVNPVTEESPKDDSSTKKDGSTTSQSSKDTKKENPEKQVQPEKKDDIGKKDKTKIEESKDQSNRNKTIELMNNKNKNQNK